MTNTAYLQHGSADNLPMCTEQVEMKEKLLPWQELGLSYTASGYGSKIPTRFMVKFYGRWHRVYCRVFSNVGSLYIVSQGDEIRVNVN